VVIALLLGQRSPPAAEPATGGGTGTAGPADGGGGNTSGSDITLVAEGVAFTTDQIEIPARRDVSVTLDNQDTVAHDFAIYENEQDGQAQSNPLFKGDQVAAGESTSYEFKSPAPGDYYFQCDIHPTMNGGVTVQ
jgi:plastocyanin